MGKKRHLLILIGVVFFFATFILLENLETVSAQECRIVRLHGGAGVQVRGLRIEPDFLVISKGGCVIWSNWVRGVGEDVKVIFEEGKTCRDMTEAPSGFKLDESSCYVTSWLPFGATSSLKFKEEGTFAYTVETQTGKKAKGTINVVANQ
jgi:hypothetical protein